ncbi:hypothetical protein JCGZ_17734 [Jatropha curcas]|uniref:Uncharacterized protein n=1 Tax=Jatropha curcas TaxID=180498 RepID=A0A067JRJ3_JATCU|nr:hypothetical protein JCGZ_17734 [Jatropha curcas]
MEMGCMWMRRVRSVVLVNHPSMDSSSAWLSIPYPNRSHLSLSSLKQLSSSPPPPNLHLHPTSLFSSARRSVSPAACSSSLLPVDMGSRDMNAILTKGSKVLLKGMNYTELEVCFSTLFFFLC